MAWAEEGSAATVVSRGHAVGKAMAEPPAGGGGVGESGDQSWRFKHTWVVDSIAGSAMPSWAKIRLWAVLFFLV